MSKELWQKAGEILWINVRPQSLMRAVLRMRKELAVDEKVPKLCEQFDAEKATMSKQLWQKAGETVLRMRKELAVDESAQVMRAV